ncbi:MAG: argininosuccinate lyase, partial [Oscillospiraceae bacterium]
MKLWSGRFNKNTDALVDELNASISFDFRMYKQDIAGSLAHSAMLARQGIITKEDAEKIAAGLGEILDEIQGGTLSFGNDAEDIHMAIEGELTRRIGDAGKRLHTARSRNDQVALDFRLYLKQEIPELRELCLELLETILQLARRNTEVIMPAYTHLQRAQPTSFAHYMMAYANMLMRDLTRLEDCAARMDECPLGSGALTSTTYPIDRDFVAKELGFARVTQNSIDGVSDRDYALELLNVLSILMMHLSRFS